MKHFNKNTFIGKAVWSAIVVLAKGKAKELRFEYKAEGRRIYCENYGNTFAIVYIPE